jgi:signal-transduction protein with cAMP-binding, CBS, and nucleotidyltransferase domain
VEVREGMSEVVLTLGNSHTLREAAIKMTERKVGAAIVLDESAPGPGIVSERDIIGALAAGQDPDEEMVGDHMTSTIISAAPDWSLERAAVEMARRHIRHLVVVEHGEIVGVLSMRDIIGVWVSDGATSAMTSPAEEATA